MKTCSKSLKIPHQKPYKPKSKPNLMARCISCGKETSEGIKLPCPSCKKEIFRCNKCRNLSIEYNCKCEHQGP